MSNLEKLYKVIDRDGEQVVHTVAVHAVDVKDWVNDGYTSDMPLATKPAEVKKPELPKRTRTRRKPATK